jgi:hypothetical protein
MSVPIVRKTSWFFQLFGLARNEGICGIQVYRMAARTPKSAHVEAPERPIDAVRWSLSLLMNSIQSFRCDSSESERVTAKFCSMFGGESKRPPFTGRISFPAESRISRRPSTESSKQFFGWNMWLHRARQRSSV